MNRPSISRVEISNFRSFKNLEVDLEPTSVIVGENQAGKSNFLDALRLVLDPSLSDVSRKLRAEDFWDGLGKPFGGHTIEVKVYIRDFGENKGAKAVLADCLVTPSPLTALLTYQFRPIYKIPAAGLEVGEEEPATGAALDLTEDDYEYVVFGGGDQRNFVGAEVRKWLAMVLLPALRDAENDIQTWKKSPLRPLLERVRKSIPGQKFLEVRQELDQAKAKLLKAEPIGKLVQAVNSRIRSLAGPIHAVATDLDFAASEPEQLIKSLRIFLRETRTKPLSDASLGTANILFLALLLQETEMRQQAKEIVSTILAIEEPEAHLHPQLQRLLFRYFLGRSHPILVTTHSPNIASVAPLESLVLLRRVGDETQAFSPRGVNFTPQETADLQRYLDVTRAEILFARAVILVEGLAEQFLVPAFAAAYLQTEEFGCSSLDDLGISVCSVNGTDFAPFRKLLSQQGLFIPNAVVTDGDRFKDSEDQLQYAGLKRGVRLLDKQYQPAVEGLLNDGPGHAAEVLAERGIFVGDRTLEIDLVETLAAEMKEAYRELRNSTPASTKFDAAIDSLADDADDEQAAAEMLTRVEAVGKGRFAQRLAGKLECKLECKKPPAYIRKAIAHAVRLVRGSDAEPD